MRINRLPGYDKTNFTSTIDVVPQSVYDELISNTKSKLVMNAGNTTAHSKVTPLSPRAHAYGIMSNAAFVVVEPGKAGDFYNATYKPASLSSLTDNSPEKLRAFVAGGHRGGVESHYSSAIKDLDVRKVPTSYMMNLDGANAQNVAYDLKNDKYTLALLNDAGFDYNPQNIKRFIEQFKNFFIADGDKLLVKGKPVDVKLLKRLFKKIV